LIPNSINFSAFIFPCIDNAEQNFSEGWQVITRYGRKICPRIKRAKIRSKKYRHGPAAGAGHGLRGLHVNTIEVGAFFAIHFDADEVFVHERSNRQVFKRFVRHHMTPMASRITDAQKDRFVFSACFG
jgi:hypothetical protein